MQKNIEIRNIEVYKNEKYDIFEPYITVITPIYNRRKTIKRTLASVEKQSYRNFEYIIVDDGSTDSADDIVFEYMKCADLPVMYIKKQNGGVHTARNMAIFHARGDFLLALDSDDELVPNALQVFCDTWQQIPDEKRGDYREIVAQCVNESGERVGLMFPDNINDVSWNQAQKMVRATHGEHFGYYVTKILKDNPWPEPEGVTFVTENILWNKLACTYKSWFINDTLRIYHKEGDDHLSGRHQTKTLQSCRNALWESTYRLKHWKVYGTTVGDYLKTVVRYCIMSQILKQNKDKFYSTYKLVHVRDNICKVVLWIPSFFGALIYTRMKMKDV